MVLVDADAVEAELIGEFELVEIAVVELMAALGIVEAFSDRSPRRCHGSAEVLRQVRPGHQVKAKNASNSNPTI